MTDRLYYTDAYLTDFDARVLEVGPANGRRTAVLDRTAFYPTSGGQPFDTGTLAAARIVDVAERDDGAVLHVFEGVLEPGPVRGRVDWARRFDHMQQHTGQHLLSAAFDRLCHARTESFHLGSTAATIDLGREVHPADITRAEAEANRVVWEDRPVTIRFVDADEASQLPLRKEPPRSGRLRLIDVEDFDLSACGGTHVARTGAIGIIVVSGWERFRAGTRVEFRCGTRALRAYTMLRDIVASSIRSLSVLPDQLPAGIERLQLEGKELRRRLKDAQSHLADHEAAVLADRAQSRGPARLVVESLEGWDAAGLKNIATAIAERPGHAAILFSTPPPSAIVVARAADLALDAAALLKHLIAKFGGKGGGRPELAQGGGLHGSREEIAAFASSLV